MRCHAVLITVLATTGLAAADGADDATNSSDARPWHGGLAVGAAIPRRELDPGVFVGALGTIAIDARHKYSAVVDVDWFHTGKRSTAMLSPPAFPRSASDLDERADLITLSGGGRVVIARTGDITFRAQLTVGVQIERARFGVYAMSRVERGAGPAGAVGFDVSGHAGPAAWRGGLSWRESRCHLGEVGGDQTTSAALVFLGMDW